MAADWAAPATAGSARRIRLCRESRLWRHAFLSVMLMQSTMQTLSASVVVVAGMICFAAGAFIGHAAVRDAGRRIGHSIQRG